MRHTLRGILGLVFAALAVAFMPASAGAQESLKVRAVYLADKSAYLITTGYSARRINRFKTC